MIGLTRGCFRFAAPSHRINAMFGLADRQRDVFECDLMQMFAQL